MTLSSSSFGGGGGGRKKRILFSEMKSSVHTCLSEDNNNAVTRKHTHMSTFIDSLVFREPRAQ